MKFLKAIAIFVGTIIGAGIFGLPYVIGKSGIFPGFFYFLILGGVVLLIHLLLGEATLRTQEPCRLPGLAHKYLGPSGRILVMISVISGLLAALLAYLILSNEFLKILFSSLSDWPSDLSILFFWIFLSYFIFRGVKVIATIEVLTNIVFFAAMLFILGVSLPQFNFGNVKLMDFSNIFLPFGVILFSLIGWSAVPEVIDFLKSSKELKKIKKAMILAAVLVIPFYAIFALAILGIAGSGVAPDALSSLSPFLGTKIIALGVLAALITLADSILILGLHLKNTFIHDFKLSNNWAAVIACGLPIIAFLAGFRNFISILGIAGTLVGVIQGVVIILIFNRAKKMGDRIPEYSLKVSSVLLYFLIATLILGAISQFLL